MSIRAVNREAGLGPASVHYHFGTRRPWSRPSLHVYGDDGDRATSRPAPRRSPSLGVPAPTRARPGHDAGRAVPRSAVARPTRRVATGCGWSSQILQQDPDRILDRPSGRLTWNAAATVYPGREPCRRAARDADVPDPAGHPARAGTDARRARCLDVDLLRRLPQRRAATPSSGSRSRAGRRATA